MYVAIYYIHRPKDWRFIMCSSITADLHYVGINDTTIDLFEGQYNVPHGMSYNSYIIKDEKSAVMDTVDAHFGAEWLAQVAATLGSTSPDYLVVHHMEPDHSANIALFAEKYPSAIIVSSKQAFAMMKQFFGTDFPDRQLVVGEGSTLPLGSHTLNFVTAPMVHWPEVIMSYDSKDKVLFSADGFGKFGAVGIDEDWADEARRYYFGIVGKYGAQVQAVLKKAQALDIAKICPLHGPVLTENLGYYIGLYDKWSSYTPEVDGTFIAYTSVYGNTKKAAELLAEKLAEKGAKAELCDLARSDMSKAVENAFKYSKLTLATTTYNAGLFPFMRDFVDHLIERNYQKRKVGIIENGSWAPVAAKAIKAAFEKSKEIEFAQTVTVRSALNSESAAAIAALAEELK